MLQRNEPGIPERHATMSDEVETSSRHSTQDQRFLHAHRFANRFVLRHFDQHAESVFEFLPGRRWGRLGIAVDRLNRTEFREIGRIVRGRHERRQNDLKKEKKSKTFSNTNFISDLLMKTKIRRAFKDQHDA